jgi:K+ transporter
MFICLSIYLLIDSLVTKSVIPFDYSIFDKSHHIGVLSLIIWALVSIISLIAPAVTLLLKYWIDKHTDTKK